MWCGGGREWMGGRSRNFGLYRGGGSAAWGGPRGVGPLPRPLPARSSRRGENSIAFRGARGRAELYGVALRADPSPPAPLPQTARERGDARRTPDARRGGMARPRPFEAGSNSPLSPAQRGRGAGGKGAPAGAARGTSPIFHFWPYRPSPSLCRNCRGSWCEGGMNALRRCDIVRTAPGSGPLSRPLPRKLRGREVTRTERAVRDVEEGRDHGRSKRDRILPFLPRSGGEGPEERGRRPAQLEARRRSSTPGPTTPPRSWGRGRPRS
jgi:hypothetical protein